MSQEEIIEKKETKQKWRVKLYELSQGKQWTDNGTGYLYSMEKPQASLIMEVTNRNKELFEFVINDNVEFNLQNKTILTWRKNNQERQGYDDTAISFQEKEGINEIWKFICHFTGKKDFDDDLSCGSDNIIDALCDVSKTNLPFIAKEIREDLDDSQIKDLLFYIKSGDCDFIKRLGKILIEEEKELERKDGSSLSSATTISLQSSVIDINQSENDSRKTTKESKSLQKNLPFIFSIFKNIIILADEELIKYLLSDSLYMITFGALEHDFESLQSNVSLRHRDYLKNEAHFNNYLNITDDELLNKIHFNYRLIYLRNTALTRVIKEGFNQMIKAMIKKNNEDIVFYFITHKEIINSLINKLEINKGTLDDNTTIKEGICFITELISCAKETGWLKVSLNSALCECKLLDKLVNILIDSTNQLPNQARILAIRIFLEMTLCFPLLIKDIIIELKAPILFLISECVLNQNDLSFKYDLAHLISILFDNCSVYDPMENKLKDCLLYLINLLPQENMSPESRVIILTILCQSLSLPRSITQLEGWANDNDIEEKSLEIKTMTRNRKIVLHLIQFLNTMVMNNYDMIFSESTIDWIISLFNSNITKGNAISSAILSLFNSIKRKKHSLIRYIFSIRDYFFYENHKYFKGLIEEYENDSSNSDEKIVFNPQYMTDIVNEDNVFKDDNDIFNNEIDCDRNYNYGEEEENITFLGKKTHPSTEFDDIINSCSHFSK